MKKWLIPTIIVLVLAAAVVVFMKQEKAPVSTETEQEKAFDPANPNFKIAEVVSAEGSTIVVKSGPDQYNVVVGSETKLVKQVLGEDDVLVLVDAAMVDFKAKSTIVVHYPEGDSDQYITKNASGESVIYASKVQLISQP